MAIMAVIMTVIMSIISPTTKVASKIESLKDEEDIAIRAGREISNQLSYATKVYVVAADDADGIPTAEKTYKNVYVIDNTTHRSMSNYNAPGIITLGNWNGSTITESVAVMGEAAWFHDAYNMAIDEYGTDIGNSYIMLTFRGYPMVPDGETDTYVPDKTKEYTYKEGIDFVNINNKQSLIKGGNSGAGDFIFKIDAESIATKHDKIYIFFVPASETALATTKASYVNTNTDANASAEEPVVSTNPTVSTPESTVESTPESTGGSTSTESTPSTENKHEITYKTADGTGTIHKVTISNMYGNDLIANNYSHISPLENPEYDESVTHDGYRYEFVDWYTAPNGGGKKRSDYSISKAEPNTIVFYAYYKKIDTVKVTVKNQDGSVNTALSTVVDKGSDITNLFSDTQKPEFDSAKYIFKNWKGLTTNVSADVTVEGEYEEIPSNVKVTTLSVRFSEAFSGGIKVDSYSKQASYNGSPKTAFNSNSGSAFPNQTRSNGDEDKLVIYDENNEGARLLYTINGYELTIGLTKDQIDGTEHKFYFYYNVHGEPTITDGNTYSSTASNASSVTIHFLDDDILDKLIFSGWPNATTGSTSATDFALPGATTRTILGMGSSSEAFVGACKKGDQTINYYKDLQIFACYGSFQYPYKFAADGAAHHMYVYRDFSGGLKISYNDPGTMTTVYLNFLNLPDPNEIEIAGTAPNVFVAGEQASAIKAPGTYRKNQISTTNPLRLVLLTDTVIGFEGQQFTLTNDGVNKQYWYYNKALYGTKNEAEAAKAKEEAGGDAFTVSVYFITDGDQYNNFLGVKSVDKPQKVSYNGTEYDVDQNNIKQFANNLCKKGAKISVTCASKAIVQESYSGPALTLSSDYDLYYKNGQFLYGDAVTDKIKKEYEKAVAGDDSLDPEDLAALAGGGYGGALPAAQADKYIVTYDAAANTNINKIFVKGYNCTTEIYNATTGKLLKTIKGDQGHVDVSAYQGTDTRYVIVTSGETNEFWLGFWSGDWRQDSEPTFKGSMNSSMYNKSVAFSV